MKKVFTYLGTLGLLWVALTLAGCGYKGPLTLPESTSTSNVTIND